MYFKLNMTNTIVWLSTFYLINHINYVLGDPVAKKTPKIIAQAGQQLQMTCPISGYPIFNINWEKGILLYRI